MHARCNCRLANTQVAIDGGGRQGIGQELAHRLELALAVVTRVADFLVLEQATQDIAADGKHVLAERQQAVRVQVVERQCTDTLGRQCLVDRHIRAQQQIQAGAIGDVRHVLQHAGKAAGVRRVLREGAEAGTGEIAERQVLRQLRRRVQDHLQRAHRRTRLAGKRHAPGIGRHFGQLRLVSRQTYQTGLNRRPGVEQVVRRNTFVAQLERGTSLDRVIHYQLLYDRDRPPAVFDRQHGRLSRCGQRLSQIGRVYLQKLDAAVEGGEFDLEADVFGRHVTRGRQQRGPIQSGYFDCVLPIDRFQPLQLTQLVLDISRGGKGVHRSGDSAGYNVDRNCLVAAVTQRQGSSIGAVQAECLNSRAVLHTVDHGTSREHATNRLRCHCDRNDIARQQKLDFKLAGKTRSTGRHLDHALGELGVDCLLDAGGGGSVIGPDGDSAGGLPGDGQCEIARARRARHGVGQAERLHLVHDALAQHGDRPHHRGRRGVASGKRTALQHQRVHQAPGDIAIERDRQAGDCAGVAGHGDRTEAQRRRRVERSGHHRIEVGSNGRHRNHDRAGFGRSTSCRDVVNNLEDTRVGTLQVELLHLRAVLCVLGDKRNGGRGERRTICVQDGNHGVATAKRDGINLGPGSCFRDGDRPQHLRQTCADGDNLFQRRLDCRPGVFNRHRGDDVVGRCGQAQLDSLLWRGQGRRRRQRRQIQRLRHRLRSSLGRDVLLAKSNQGPQRVGDHFGQHQRRKVGTRLLEADVPHAGCARHTVRIGSGHVPDQHLHTTQDSVERGFDTRRHLNGTRFGKDCVGPRAHDVMQRYRPGRETRDSGLGRRNRDGGHRQREAAGIGLWQHQPLHLFAVLRVGQREHIHRAGAEQVRQVGDGRHQGLLAEIDRRAAGEINGVDSDQIGNVELQDVGDGAKIEERGQRAKHFLADQLAGKTGVTLDLEGVVVRAADDAGVGVDVGDDHLVVVHPTPVLVPDVGHQAVVKELRQLVGLLDGELGSAFAALGQRDHVGSRQRRRQSARCWRQDLQRRHIRLGIDDNREAALHHRAFLIRLDADLGACSHHQFQRGLDVFGCLAVTAAHQDVASRCQQPLAQGRHYGSHRASRVLRHRDHIVIALVGKSDVPGQRVVGHGRDCHAVVRRSQCLIDG